MVLATTRLAVGRSVDALAIATEVAERIPSAALLADGARLRVMLDGATVELVQVGGMAVELDEMAAGFRSSRATRAWSAARTERPGLSGVGRLTAMVAADRTNEAGPLELGG